MQKFIMKCIGSINRRLSSSFFEKPQSKYCQPLLEFALHHNNYKLILLIERNFVYLWNILEIDEPAKAFGRMNNIWNITKGNIITWENVTIYWAWAEHLKCWRCTKWNQASLEWNAWPRVLLTHLYFKQSTKRNNSLTENVFYSKIEAKTNETESQAYKIITFANNIF